MMTLILKGINRKSVVSTQDSKLFEEFKKWLHDYETFSYYKGNEYIFPRDSLVTACNIKARKLGLIAKDC